MTSTIFTLTNVIVFFRRRWRLAHAFRFVGQRDPSFEEDLVTHFAVLSNSQEDEAVFEEAL